MFDKDDPRQHIVNMLPMFSGIMASALMRKDHELPSKLHLAVPSDNGAKEQVTVSLDFSKPDNLYVFDTYLWPMIRSMYQAAVANRMTSLTALFDNPAMQQGLRHGVVMMSWDAPVQACGVANLNRKPLGWGSTEPLGPASQPQP